MFISRRRLLAALATVSIAAGSAALAPTVGASAAQGTSSAATPLVAGIDTPDGNVTNAISQLGVTPKLINTFTGFQSSSGQTLAFPTKWAQEVIGMGSTPMVTWQPNLPTYKTTSVLNTIANGSLDSYIESWAQAAAATHHAVLVRLMHEFNGNWYPWGAVVAGKTVLPSGSGTYSYSNTPAMYVAAFQHVVKLFRAVGATNVEFVWCVATSAPTANVSAYYPGDAYVAWPSMDGYNRSGTSPAPAQTIFGSGYAAITQFTSEHILIAEMASVEYSGLSISPSSKADWITNAYQTIPVAFPQIRAVDWFDCGTGYPFTTSQTALQAIRQVFASTQYSANLP